MNILVVEDNIKLNDNIVDILSFEGYNVLSTTNITDAKKAYKRHNPNIIILDIMLPECNSYEEIDFFKSNMNTYIIMLTALNTSETKRICYESGADDYITKPFSLNELVFKIKAINRRIKLSSNKISIGDIIIDKKELTITCKDTVMLSLTLFEIFETLCNHYISNPASPKYYEVEKHEKSRVQTAINRIRNSLYEIGSKNIYIKNMYKKGYVIEVKDE